MSRYNDRDLYAHTGDQILNCLMRIRRRWSWTFGVLVAAQLMATCARAEEPTTESQGNQKAITSHESRSGEATPPATDELLRLDPESPIWIDVVRKQVVVEGEVCLREGSLEMFACPWYTKEHESVLSVPVRSLTVHAGLLAVGALPGKPARWTPKFEPAHGALIEVTVFWTDEDGQQQQCRGQDWIRDIKTGKAMEQSWVFGGSVVKGSYQADFGDFICVSNFPGAMLDVPVESSDKAEQLQFEAFTERIPPRGTKVTLVLMPKSAKDAKQEAPEPGVSE
jgi:hypothetical protein